MALAPLLILVGCSGGADDGALAEEGEAAISGRVACALEGARVFERNCTVAEMDGGDGTTLIVGRDDSGYRRLQIATDGRGVIAADGSQPATVTVIGDGMIEVAIGADRYRLPANTKPVD